MTQQEIEQMVVDSEKLVYFVVNKYFYDLREDDDIIQVGRIGLWKACIGYDSSRSKFSTFAVRCILNEIRMELRERAKLLRFGNVASLDEPLYFDEETGSAVTLAHLTPDPRNDYCVVDNDISFLSKKLSERDVNAFKMSIYGFTMDEIGKVFGHTKAWASRTVSNARAIVKAKMAYT